jgi:hypothetical protein
MLLCIFALFFSVRGEGPDVAHCDGAADVKLLRAYAGGTFPAPKTRFSQVSDDDIAISITVPYLPMRMKYNVAFGSQLTPCSSLFGNVGIFQNEEYDTSEDPDGDPWTFAPNANYPEALTGKYNANYVSNQSIWRAAPVDCAHVVYTTVLSFDDLARCQDATAILKVGDAYALLSTLSVEALVPQGQKLDYRHTYELSAYVDTNGNSIVLFESSLSKSNVALKQLSIGVDTMLLRFQTASAENLQLSSIAVRDKCSIALHRNNSGIPPSYSHKGLLIQNWDFYSESTKACHFQLLYEATDFVSTIDVFLSVETSAILNETHISEIHSAIAQHKPTEVVAHEGGFLHGERVCMQSYLLLPEDIQLHSEVLMLSAWLCPDDEQKNCANHTNSVLLYENGKPMREDVTLTSPGAYGPCSVALCFNANAKMTDRNHNTFVRTEQRYESLIALQALKTSLRQTTAEFFEKNTRETPKALSARAAFVMSLHQKPFSASSLEHSLRAARVSDSLRNHEQQIYKFVVDPGEELLQNISDGDAILIILLIVGVSLAVILIYIVIVLRKKPTNGDLVIEERIESHYSR